MLFRSYSVQHRNGHYIWMEASISAIVENGEVKQLVTIARDITERKKFRDELARMAFYDFLSGLPNRRTFDDRLEMAIQQANRFKKKVAVMMLDGCKFKRINDTFGHDAGDAVIKEMAKRLKSSLREMDTVARLGGDEFAVILPEISSVQFVEDIAKRVLHSFEEPFYFLGLEIKMGAGMGISIYPDHSTDKKCLMKFADKALYEAKKYGVNEYRMFGKQNKDFYSEPEGS